MFLAFFQNLAVSYAARHAIIRLLKPKEKHKKCVATIPSPPRCSTPGAPKAQCDDDVTSEPPSPSPPVQQLAQEAEEENMDDELYENVLHFHQNFTSHLYISLNFSFSLTTDTTNWTNSLAPTHWSLCLKLQVGVFLTR